MKVLSAIVPRLSDKTYDLSLKRNCFVFLVPPSMNRLEVIAAVKKQYEVDAINVNIVKMSGKKVRSYQNRRFISGQRRSFKKAYVTLLAGQTLPIFAGSEEPSKADKVAVSRSAKRTAKAKEKK